MKRSTTIVLRDELSEPNLRHLHVTQRLSVREIAAQLDVAVGTVYRSFRYHQITMQPVAAEYHKPHLSDLLTEKALSEALNNEGLTVAQIAARHDCSVQTIYTYLKRHGIERPDRRPRTHKPSELIPDTVVDFYINQRLSVRQTAQRLNLSSKALRDLMDLHGIERRQTQQHTLDSQRIAIAYQSGATLAQLAKQHQCSVWTITKHLDNTQTPRR